MEAPQTGIFYAGAMGAAPSAEFPRRFRRPGVRGIDRRFTAFLTGTALVLAGVTAVLSMRDMPEAVSEQEVLRIQERYARLVLDRPEPKPQARLEPEERSAGEGEAAETEPEESAEPDREEETYAEKQQRKEATRGERRAQREQVAREVQSKGIFAAITAAGGSGGERSEGVADILGAAGAGVGDMSDIAISKGTFAASESAPAQLSQRRGTKTTGVELEKGGVEKVTGARVAATGEVAVTSEAPDLKAESGSPVTGRACIQRVVNRESRRIKRVYENWLKRDPGLSGQLKIRFTIMPNGSVANVSVAGSTMDNAQFDENILRYVRRWDFSSCSIAEMTEVVYPFAFESAS